MNQEHTCPSDGEDQTQANRKKPILVTGLGLPTLLPEKAAIFEEGVERHRLLDHWHTHLFWGGRGRNSVRTQVWDSNYGTLLGLNFKAVLRPTRRLRVKERVQWAAEPLYWSPGLD